MRSGRNSRALMIAAGTILGYRDMRSGRNIVNTSTKRQTILGYRDMRSGRSVARDTPYPVICSNEDRNWLQRPATNSNLNFQIRT